MAKSQALQPDIQARLIEASLRQTELNLDRPINLNLIYLSFKRVVDLLARLVHQTRTDITVACGPMVAPGQDRAFGARLIVDDGAQTESRTFLWNGHVLEDGPGTKVFLGAPNANHRLFALLADHIASVLAGAAPAARADH